MGAVVLSCARVGKDFPTPDWRQGRRPALGEVDLEIREGERVALLGPNGSGKSTLLQLAVGLRHPDRGTVRLRGRDPRRARARRQTGYLPELPPGDPQAPARDMVRACARLGGAGRGSGVEVEELLGRVGLAGRGRARLRDCSRGMRQRMALATVLAGDPSFLLLDEPLAGLDPQGRELVGELLDSRRGEGQTLLFASHRWGRLERAADRVVFLEEGRILWQGAPAELVEAGVGGRPALAFPGAAERDRARVLVTAAGLPAEPVAHDEDSLEVFFRRIFREPASGGRPRE